MDSIKKVLINKQGRRFYVRSLEQDHHNQFGVVKKEQLQVQDGSKIVSNTGEEFYLYSPFFRDLYSRIKRGAQIIPLKDIGMIVAEAGITKESRVLDCGAGSGAFCCFLASIAKEVIAYEIREDFFKTVQENISSLGLNNISLKLQDIYLGIDETDLDVITLDLPEPWKVLDHAANALKAGGFIVSYSPTIPQVADFVNAVHDHASFTHIKTLEIIERTWEVKGRKVRPQSLSIGHSGFLSFCRKLQ